MKKIPLEGFVYIFFSETLIGIGEKMDFISLKVENSIGILTLNRPPINSLNLQVYQELRNAIQSISERREIRVVILRAEGKNFSFGNDVAEFTKFTTGNILIDYAGVASDCVRSLYECLVPFIGAVNGLAVGTGCALVSCCDVIIASENAKFSMPEIKVGIVGAACFLSRILPQHLHRYMAFTGDVITAEQMKQYGAVLKVVPENQLLESAIGVAKRIAELPPLAIKELKAAINRNENAQLKEKYALEIKYGASLM
ncbi:MAG: enoyl-CoA hydratase/isomerase family protein, partial [Syntrophales bacterium]